MQRGFNPVLRLGIKAAHGTRQAGLCWQHVVAVPALAFFSLLEDEMHGAVKVAQMGQLLGCTDQYAGVAVMAAAVVNAGRAPPGPA